MRNFILGSAIFYFLAKSFLGWSMDITSVNGAPKLAHDQRNFSTYWGLWLELDEFEKTSSSFVITNKTTQIKTWSCENSKLELNDSESFYLFDKISLDENGEVIPIREAYRPGYRYFSIANIAGLYIRGQKRPKRLKRKEAESYSEYKERTDKARSEWRVKANPKGAYGEVKVSLDFRAFGGDEQETKNQESFFLNIADYREEASEYYDYFKRYAPGNWPVHYDERAHKPHHFKKPNIWNSSEISNFEFEATIKWNWCSDNIRVIVETPNEIPASGPNRIGRDTSAGNIEVIRTN